MTGAGRSAADLGVVTFAPGVRGIALRTPTLPPATTTWCWILGEGERGFLVEPASPWIEEQRRLGQALRALEREEGYRPGRALLTHLHPDHVGGANAVRDRGVALHAHPLTGEAVLDLGIEVDAEVGEGDVWTAGEGEEHTWVALHTPGHARGHVALLQPARGVVVAGDLVAGEGTVVIDPPEGDLGDYLRSLDRLIGLGARLLLPAHGPPIQDGPALLRGYIAHRLAREGQVVEGLRAAGARPSVPEDLVPGIYASVPRVLWPAAARSVLAHLLKLVQEGRADEGPPGRFRLRTPSPEP
ncbi:MBL fold metallo-hydrolase [Myxococcota bacterium]|nr:MBL fold metallo-hydrolase [Myxococcota bacterium]